MTELAHEDGNEVQYTLERNPFFAPAGGPLGDTFPFFHEGACHLFALQPPHVAHFVSSDFVHWATRPIAIPSGAPGDPDAGMIATGAVVDDNGTFYMFYTAGPAQTICLATSGDLDHWTRHPDNPILVGDDERYVPTYFRDPYVFFNQAEDCWWMLLGTRVQGKSGQRAGCVGLAKSTDLLNWQLHEPLWAPGIGPHCDCPQLIEVDRRWYLLYLQRNTRYRVADSPEGPFERPPIRDIGTAYASAASRPVFDGQRWITFPFVVRHRDESDLGDWEYGGPLPVPRELHFLQDGSITERPLTEIVSALNRLPILPAEQRRSHALIGEWDTSEVGRMVCRSSAGGTLLFPHVPGDLYLEAEVILPKREMEAHLILRAAEDLTTGYKLALHPNQEIVDVRHISGNDVDRVMVSRHVPLPVGKPIKVQILVADSVLDVFIANRASITTRVYELRQGALALEFRDAAGAFEKVKLRRLQGHEIR